MWQPLIDAYRDRIVDTGREPLFLLLLGLVLSFLFIRLSTRMIRARVRWWPGNVAPGGLHIHHVVFGQTLLLVCGVAAFAVRGDGGDWWNLLGFGFGVGAGLVLDEFALVLHLKDVYWSTQGRTSVDAVMLAAAAIGLLLVGELPLGGFARHPDGPTLAGAAVLLALVVVSLLKGKTWTGLLGIMLWPLALVGAVRLARPASPWARWRYRSRPRRLARAERREDRIHRRLVAVKTAAYDLVAGTPDADPEAPPEAAAPEPAPVDPVPVDSVPAEPVPGRPPARWRLRCAAAARWYLRIATLLNLLGALVAPFRAQVERADRGEYFTPVLVTSGFTTALLTGLLAVMLRRRKRAAWIAALAVTAVHAAVYALALAFPEYRAHPFNWVSAALTLALLLALLAARPVFRVRGGRGNLPLAAAVLLLGGALLTGLGAVAVRLAHTDGVPGWGEAARYAVLRLVTVSGVLRVTDVDVPGWVDLGLNLLATALLLLTLRILLRSAHGAEGQGPEDERALRALLERHGGRDSLGYFALRRDKSVCFSPSGKAAVAYRVVNGVALASGDPVGDPEAWPQAIEEWLRRARAHAWIPAVTGAGERGGTVYVRTAGLRALHLGDEAVVAAAGFTLEGREMRGLRQTCRRLARAGYTVVVRRHRDVPAVEFADLVRLADAWRHGRTERGFSMALGRLGDPADGDCLLAECRDGAGRTAALLSFVPWGADGLSLDLMRRDRESDNGLVEYTVAELLLRAGEFGTARVSLNFAMFREAFEPRLGAGPVLRLWRGVLRFLSRWWQLESLYRANARYRPVWEPRYVLYEKPSELPAIGLATALAEGFLTRPRLRRGRRRADGASPGQNPPGARAPAPG
ncbi:phosphatidylglycerol lysyltransferase domain-containing protein [Kitasatospora sp. YST-16]|uniref:phosphatidylglycerol lysyltransferase domain-containing protein n=1 Tax=Kitasatospora sp. YST-16 TaxID=2998080 RepID=UPI0022849935|nr:phosphatidylglycerol lysyltransferase domain-containing protein [Kitasatospora sp. YST-16]WAL71981.1 phosphatidylglycerol lysyltransferase domain-containing protein [Kitasatospora sp. YST-16]WNW38028.1 phosphatidylglycerol lysyltransferase domain-containing protein [Streptomyces sp. Li-HN-5-13]